MTEKVQAEGSIWRMSPALSPREVAERIGSVKTALLTFDIWRIYCAPGETPSEKQMAKLLGIGRASCVAAPDHLAMVTPDSA